MNIEHFYSTYFTAGKISIDSRKIKHNDVFFAFSGERFNAAIFAENAIEQGAKAVIVEDENYRTSKDFYATYNCDDLHKSSFWTMKNSDFLIDVVNSGRDKIPDTWIDAIRSYLIVTSENFIEIVSFDEPRIIIM